LRRRDRRPAGLKLKAGDTFFIPAGSGFTPAKNTGQMTAAVVLSTYHRRGKASRSRRPAK